MPRSIEIHPDCDELCHTKGIVEQWLADKHYVNLVLFNSMTNLVGETSFGVQALKNKEEERLASEAYGATTQSVLMPRGGARQLANLAGYGS